MILEHGYVSATYLDSPWFDEFRFAVILVLTVLEWRHSSIKMLTKL